MRDYSPAATKLFNGPVPAQFVTALKKNPGTWTEVFGPRMAEEAFEVYYLSTYIDTVAKAGKAVYRLDLLQRLDGRRQHQRQLRCVGPAG